MCKTIFHYRTVATIGIILYFLITSYMFLESRQIVELQYKICDQIDLQNISLQKLQNEVDKCNSETKKLNKRVKEAVQKGRNFKRAKRVKKIEPKAVKKPMNHSILFENIKDSYQAHGIRTSIALLDVLLASFIKYQDNEYLKNGDTLTLLSKHITDLINLNKEQYGGNIADLSGFKSICLNFKDDKYTFKIEVMKKGEIAIPNSFGSKISYTQDISGYIVMDINSSKQTSKPHLLVHINRPESIQFLAPFWSATKGIKSLKIHMIEILPFNIKGESNLICMLYGERKDGQSIAIRTNIENPSLVFAKGVNINERFLVEKQNNISAFPVQLN